MYALISSIFGLSASSVSMLLWKSCSFTVFLNDLLLLPLLCLSWPWDWWAGRQQDHSLMLEPFWFWFHCLKSTAFTECKDLPWLALVCPGHHWHVGLFWYVPTVNRQHLSLCLFERDGSRIISPATVRPDRKWDLLHTLQLTSGKLLQPPVLLSCPL